MKKLILFLIVLALFVPPVIAEEKIASVAQKKVLLFWGKGFAIDGPIATHKTMDFSIHHVFSANLNRPVSDAEKVVVAALVLGKEKYPVKVISPKLEAFEADIMDPAITEGTKKMPIPVGHLTFKLLGPSAVGKMTLRVEEKEFSGEFGVLLNDITDLMKVVEQANPKEGK